ncbi:outer membrane protein transport protein [Kistimonas scapharcae]|uniref:Outer membrane protein transport protein n=1 Tax=Kistimonas scapharcae TaxID=1036133 RepID=A0ABP8V7D7_9GAMM
MNSGWFDNAVKYGVLLIGSCVAGNAISAGFTLNETSAGAAGTAYAGRAANPEDASVMSANPAGIAFLDRPQFTVGGGLIVPHEKYHHGVGADSQGNDITQTSSVKGDFVGAQGVPFGFYSMPLDEPLSFGLGFYVPYAAMTEYGNDFVGRYLALNTELVTLNLQPTLSWKFNDAFAVGFGLIFSYLDGELTQLKNPSPLPANKAFKSKMTGHDWGYGWNAGMLWMPNDDTTIGVAYTSKINYTVEGDLKLKGDLVNAESHGHLKLILPEKWEISGTYKLDERWTVMGGTVWTRWSRFDEIKAIADDGIPALGIPAGGVASYTPENWKDVWAWSVGASYRLNNEWLLRAGYGYDTSPVKSAWRTARIPDIDREWLTFGASYQPVPDYTIDLAYGHMFNKNVKVDEHEYNWDNATGVVSRGAASYKAKYKVSANVLVVSLTHRL